MGTGTGLGVIMLADHGFDVTGVDNNISNIIGGIYTMTLNNIFYDLVYSDHKYVEKNEYDVLIVNASFNNWDSIITLVPMIRREKEKNKEVLFYTKKDPKKLLNFEYYIPKNVKNYLTNPPLELNYDT